MTAKAAVIITKTRLQLWRMALNTAADNAQRGRADLAVKSILELRDLIGREIEPPSNPTSDACADLRAWQADRRA